MFRPVEAMALVGMDVYDDRMVDVLDLSERRDHGLHVVAVRHVPVVEAERLEQVAFGSAVGGAQFGESLVDAAVVRRDGHLIVVEDDDEVGGHLPRVVESLKRLALAHRAIADERDDVLPTTEQITSLGHAHGHGDGGACVADHEMVVLAFTRMRVSGNVVVMGRVEERPLAAGQDLVRVGLVGDIPDEFVFRGVEHVVHGDGRFHHAQIRSDVPTGFRDSSDQRLTNLVGEGGQLVLAEPLEIRRAVDVIQVRRHEIPILRVADFRSHNMA